MMKAIDVAHYIINNSSVNNLRLNKLMYYCQHESLKKHNKPLFDDEMLAYKYGAWKEIYNGGKGERLPIPLEMIKNEVV